MLFNSQAELNCFTLEGKKAIFIPKLCAKNIIEQEVKTNTNDAVGGGVMVVGSVVIFLNRCSCILQTWGWVSRQALCNVLDKAFLNMYWSSCLSQLSHWHGQAHNWTHIGLGMAARSLLWLHRGVRNFLLGIQREEGSRQTKVAW